ncbi:MAG: hypothetical protein Q7R81_00120 [Candidatus Peregrinibacteria bacterium]|nr:hypothetical protein [Candidatus Peregrinibacteria bacterium]
MKKKTLTVLFPSEEESWNAFARRIEETEGEIVAILSGRDRSLAGAEEERTEFLTRCTKMSHRLRLATRQRTTVADARRMGIRIIDKAKDLRALLAGSADAERALRLFLPQVWRQQLRSRLQDMGLLSLPKLRILTLITLSGGLFLFVVFKLLPSSEIRVWPREDTVSQTSNVFLVLSGATVDLPDRVRTMPLLPIIVHTQRALTFDQISKEFIGTSAETQMTVVNKAEETYSLRKGSRLTNQAGMIFRLLEPVDVPVGEEVTVRARAEDVDLYSEIIGQRGNVPAGLRWDFAGLSEEERKLVYAENRKEAKGGTTAYRTVLRQEDLDIARKHLEQELFSTATQLVDEERLLKNLKSPTKKLEILYYDELTKTTFSGFVLPTQFLGEQVASIPVEGAIEYTVFAYDAQAILDMLSAEIEAHISEGKRLLPETLTLDRMVVHVIDYADELSWIKLTVDLSGTEQFVLDPLSPTGAKFGRKVREAVAGMSKADAVRIVKNLPEVEKVEVSVWPPWSPSIPSILSHIYLSAE